MRPRDTRLNTPAEMWVRLVFASRYFFFSIALFLGALAVHHGSLYEAVKAVVFLAAMIAAHVWLKQRGKLEECDRALEAMFSGEAGDEDDLEVLLNRRAALEEKRGTPGFDPWAVQAVRREINAYLRTHPDSTGRLDDRR
jgi:chloramphenicol 3-O-phosphotransferase